MLGSTGSIGTQTLEVVAGLRSLGERIEVVGLAAGRCSSALAAQAAAHGALVATAEPGALGPGIRHLAGPGSASALVRELHAAEPLDMVVGAIVGIAGLEPTLAAVELGIDVALANKESLVAAGELVVRLASTTGARLLPVDSEHSALWQCVQGLGIGAPPVEHPRGVERVILTASGGALRGWSRERIDRATPADALAHPTWRMGPKVTVDTASLMNKGFEVMEARWLFGLPPERIGVLIHPTSTVHSLVEFTDGAMLAQLGTPDMRTAIRHALMRGRRTGAVSPERLDLARLGSMEFAEPDTELFPLLDLAYAALRRGGTAGAVLNAANERAVAAFLHPANADGSRLRFGRIAEVVRQVIESAPVRPAAGLADVLEADAAAREAADRLLVE